LVELSIAIAKSGGDRTSEALKEGLGQKGFRLAGDRHNQSALATLAEASENCLADIEDRVAGVFLTRHQHVASVHDALDHGRYVEIRGDAGVGKSAVLKHFAEQALAEGRIVALSPGRTVGKGWAVMRSVFQFDGTARQLLSDLAASGGAFLFIDSLDFFSEEERHTVVDLVRDAAKQTALASSTSSGAPRGICWRPDCRREKTIDRFDFAAAPSVSKARIMALAEGDAWLTKGTNILIFGPSEAAS
jgi:hypothetical protein